MSDDLLSVRIGRVLKNWKAAPQDSGEEMDSKIFSFENEMSLLHYEVRAAMERLEMLKCWHRIEQRMRASLKKKSVAAGASDKGIRADSPRREGILMKVTRADSPRRPQQGKGKSLRESVIVARQDKVIVEDSSNESSDDGVNVYLHCSDVVEIKCHDNVDDVSSVDCDEHEAGDDGTDNIVL